MRNLTRSKTPFWSHLTRCGRKNYTVRWHKSYQSSKIKTSWWSLVRWSFVRNSAPTVV